MKWDVVLEQNPTTKVWIAEAVGVPGGYTQGDSREQALANIREVLELIRETEGLPVPPHVELVSVEA